MKYVVLGFFNVFCLELMLDKIYVIMINFGLIVINFFDVVDKLGNYLEIVGKLVLKLEKVVCKIV